MNSVRVEMVDNLMWRTSRMRGMTRAEVEALLGIDPPTGYFSKSELVYFLGPERGWPSIDGEWLIIDFDDRGIVDTAKIVKD